MRTGWIMVLVEVSIPEVAAREIPRSHRMNQTIGAHGYQKQTVLKRTDEKSLDLELWTVEPRSDQANTGDPVLEFSAHVAIHGSDI